MPSPASTMASMVSRRLSTNAGGDVTPARASSRLICCWTVLVGTCAISRSFFNADHVVDPRGVTRVASPAFLGHPRARDHQRELKEGRAENRRRAFERAEADVQLAGLDLLLDCRRVRVDQTDLDLRSPAPELFDRRRQDVGGHEEPRSHRQRVARLEREPGDSRRGGIDLIEASAGNHQQLAAVRREAHLARRPIEQAKPELAFQLFDHHAQARRRDEERARGPRERVVLGDEQERAQLPWSCSRSFS